MSRKPSEQIKRQFDSKLRLTQIFGFNPPDGNDFNPRLMLMLSTGTFESIMHANGFYHSWPNVAYICNLMVFVCLILQLLSRLGSLLIRKDNERIKLLMREIIEYYEREEQHDEHRFILDKSLKILNRLVNGYIAVGFVINWIPNISSWIVSWYTGEFLQTAPIYLPFIDPHTLSGYIINSILIVYYALLLFICFQSGDMFYIYFIYQSIPMVNILCIKLKKFGDDLIKVKTQKISNIRQVEPSTSKGAKKVINQKELNDKKTKEIAKVEQHLIILIKEFNNYNHHLQHTLGYLELTTFSAMTFYSMAIAMSIVVTLAYSKAIGGTMVIFLISQVLVPCAFGALISHQKEKLLNELYGFQWYELSLSKQKMFLQFIHLVQNSSEFKVLVIGDLNMELFTNIMNGAYSYFTYLFNFVKLQ